MATAPQGRGAVGREGWGAHPGVGRVDRGGAGHARHVGGGLTCQQEWDGHRLKEVPSLQILMYVVR